MEHIKYDIFHSLTPLEMCVINSEYKIIYLNEIMLESAQDENLFFKDIRDIFVIDSEKNSEKYIAQVKAGESETTECRLFGRARYVKAIFVKESNQVYFVFTPFNFSSSKNYNDSLTGLPTRELFSDRALQILFRCQRHNNKMAILFMDLDGFKPVNDNYGHKAGDIVLKVIADRITKTLRKTDTVARYGGDEFILALSDLREGIHASLTAKRILRLIEEPIDLEDKSISVSASIGISIYPDDGLELKDLIKNSDSAMYNAKIHKNGYAFYNIEKFLG